jgi:Ca2+-binding RTX toxin-like protein
MMLASLVLLAACTPGSATQSTPEPSPHAHESNTCVTGGVGGDHIVGSNKDECFLGGPGPDVIIGRDGDDRVLGGEGSDALYAGPGDDRIKGGDGSDNINGGPGNDVCVADDPGGRDILRKCETEITA